MEKLFSGILIGLGFVSLAIGAVGVVIPLLPTTPFLLLAAALFGAGSKKFHRWLVETDLYKNYIGGTVGKKGMTKARKIKMLLILTCFFCAGIFFSPGVYIKVIIAVILCGHLYYFLFRIPTAEENETSETEKENV